MREIFKFYGFISISFNEIRLNNFIVNLIKYIVERIDEQNTDYCFYLLLTLYNLQWNILWEVIMVH